jgi:hypothetical protein
MTSILANTKQVDGGYYINVGSLLGRIYNRTEAATSNTGTLGGSFSTATWVWSSPNMTNANWGALSTTLATAGQAILRDMGRTVVSSTRTFRKVQLVRPGLLAPSTFGVDGQPLSGEAYFTGYIEVGLGGEGSVAGASLAPVARYGR